MAGEVIEALSGKSCGSFLEQELVKPLTLDRTFTTRAAFKDDGDVSKPCGALNDVSVFPLTDILMGGVQEGGEAPDGKNIRE